MKKNTVIRSLLCLISSLFFVLFSGASLGESGSKTNTEGERRIALVIGNAKYASSPLSNPTNDANDMAAKLKTLGFDVTLRLNTELKDFNRSITRFGETIKPGDVALFYYAGHGMQAKGRNFLIPVDSQITSEASIRTEAVDIEQVLEQLSLARVSMVILDACRNNPFERRFRGSQGSGLAQIDAPAGILIAYATSPGKVAADGAGRNGLYTSELLKAIDSPNISIESVFKRVRREVMRASDDLQTPWESSSLTGEFSFNVTNTNLNFPAANLPTGNSPLIEQEKWRSAEKIDSTESYNAYLADFPNGLFSNLAKAAISNKKSIATKTTASRSSSAFKDCEECPEIIEVTPGSFKLDGTQSDGSPKIIRIDYKFGLSKTEITQGQWRHIMGKNPSNFTSCGDDCPVEQVSWADAHNFIAKLNQKTGKKYRLPSEMEWVYSCKSGTDSEYCGGNDVDEVSWYSANSNGKTHLVAGKKANAFGFFDMSGNAWEWVSDCWSENYQKTPLDGAPWSPESCPEGRALRGGAWNYGVAGVKVSKRVKLDATDSYGSYGIRVAISIQ